ncbi:MAG: type II toxin-antitoxin system RelB/DinJ family antitoxin [Syntrophobacteraceae bacterium]|nr:type II toxin-antitoxin system RelB/DinJ family antitoxin [Syntrophobacteraceae bacterium]
MPPLYVALCMGLSISDAIRLLLVRIAEEGRLPFELKAGSRKRQVLRRR